MANQREIRRRIRSIQNTRQITRAMEMVAATKMRRAQQAVLASRAYADRARDLLASLADAAETHDQPLLERRDVKKITAVLMTSDRGLAGSMNTNVIRAGLEHASAAKAPVSFVPVGRKAEQAVTRSGLPVTASFTGLTDTPSYADVTPVAQVLVDEFLAGRADQVVLIYPKFVSTLQNRPETVALLPAEPGEVAEETKPETKAMTLFEPSPEAVLERLVPKLVEVALYQALLETKASEHSSRMMAMRNATTNASDLLDELTFSYNQARQAAITTEIAEIAAAAVSNE